MLPRIPLIEKSYRAIGVSGFRAAQTAQPHEIVWLKSAISSRIQSADRRLPDGAGVLVVGPLLSLPLWFGIYLILRAWG